jgi:hypothetical protein
MTGSAGRRALNPVPACCDAQLLSQAITGANDWTVHEIALQVPAGAEQTISYSGVPKMGERVLRLVAG